MTSTPITTPSTTVQKEKRDWSALLQQLLALASLVIIFFVFSFTSEHFANWKNVTSILLSTSVIGILALSSTIVILTGGIDLSVGTGMTLTAVITGLVTVNLGAPLIVGILAGVLAGGLLGFVNGFNIAYLDLPPFIATLAMMMIAQGLALILSNVTPIYFNEHPYFQSLATGSLSDGLPQLKEIPVIQYIAQIPNGVWILFVLTVIAWILLSKTIFGRYTYAMGSNLEAARLSGINTKTWIIAVYTVAGLFTGAGGVMMASRLNSAQPGQGAGYELQAIAAVIIGGTSLNGGRGSVVGTMIGALIMSVLLNGLSIAGVSPEWQKLVIGFVILAAVFLDRLRLKK